jgi:hypothetical protein
LSISTGLCTPALIERFAARDDLATYDPYDIWKTSLGFRVKDLYNRRPGAGLLPAAALALFDLANNRTRWLYRRQEYPIVRAFAALSLMNLYQKDGRRAWLAFARRHLEWLVEHRSTGYNGYGWGLGFPNAVSRDVIYDANTPYSTMTTYPLEAFLQFSELSGDTRFEPVIRSIYTFFDEDIQVMEETSETLATSYVPFRDRIVTNAVSYTMYAYSLFLASEPDRRRYIETKVRKLYQYVRQAQSADGSWYYSPRGRSFIDCFHSCIILKNLIKTSRLVPLAGVDAMVARGYDYLKRNMLDERSLLFRRFAVSNKPGLVKFDLYDNAEALNLALLIGDHELARRLVHSVAEHFSNGSDVYSQIDVFGARRSKNTLRWAVMPFLYAVSQMA